MMDCKEIEPNNVKFTSLLDLPPEIIDPILKLCDRESLYNLACCSSVCREHIAPILYGKIKITWSRINENLCSSQINSLLHTRSLTINGDYGKLFLGNNFPYELHTEWNDVAEIFRLIVNSCDQMLLTDILISHPSISDYDLQVLFCKFSNLKSLDLMTNSIITRETFSCLSTNLTILKLTNCDLHYCDFNNLHNLIELSLEGCILTEEAFSKSIFHLYELRKLNLDRIYCGNNQFENIELEIPIRELENLVLLEHLYLSYTTISSDDDLGATLKTLKSLKVLDIGMNLTTSLFRIICTLPSLKELNFSSVDLEDGEVLAIQNLTSLCSLSFVCQTITDIGLRHITNLDTLQRSLNELYIGNNTNITDEGLSYIVQIKTLRVLNIIKCLQITDIGLSHISQIVSLQELGIDWNRKITDDGIQRLLSLVSLNWISISGCTKLTDDSMPYITALQSLKILRLSLGMPTNGTCNLMKITENALNEHFYQDNADSVCIIVPLGGPPYYGPIISNDIWHIRKGRGRADK